MKFIITVALLILFSSPTWSQSSVEKIIVVQNTYERQGFDGEEILYRSDTVVLTRKRKISRLISELNQFNSGSGVLFEFGIDTVFILNNPDKLLELYDGYYKNVLDWNDQQIDFIFEKISNPENYRRALNAYLSHGSGYSLHQRYRYNYILILEEESGISNIYESRKSSSGYHFPYVNQSNIAVYNYEIDKSLNQLFQRELNIEEPLRGDALLKYLVDRIVYNNARELYKLSPYTYEDEISELSSDFNIVSFEQVYGMGRYIGYAPPTMKITLQSEIMLPNVYLQYLCSKDGESLYPRDSIKREYETIISRIQSISFITEYLEQDSTASLDIYYFNNNGINEYNIESVNGNPNRWQDHDEYVDQLKQNDDEADHAFNIDKAILTSERNKCGCNYRFDRDFIERAIFFEVKSDRRASSIWYLLPDDTVLLYHVAPQYQQDAQVLDLNLNEYGDLSLPRVCLLFDKNGNRLDGE